MATPAKSPEEMSDEELTAYLNGEELEEKPEEIPEQGKPEAPKEEEEQEEQPEEKKPEEKKEEDTEVSEKETEEEKKPVSRREQLRVNQLLEKLKSEGSGKPQEKAPEKQKPEAIKYEDELDADDDTLKKLNEDREKYAEERYQEGLRQAKALEDRQNAFEFRSMLQSDEPRVLGKYSFMDKESNDFDQEATSAMVAKYLNFVGFDEESKTAKNPVSYYEFVEAEMEFVQALAEKMARETRDNVTKQVANTGLRPSGSSPSRGLDLTKPAEDMSDEELDAVIASVIPSKRR